MIFDDHRPVGPMLMLASCLRAAGREKTLLIIQLKSIFKWKFWVCERLVSLTYEEDRKDSVIPSGVVEQGSSLSNSNHSSSYFSRRGLLLWPDSKQTV